MGMKTEEHRFLKSSILITKNIERKGGASFLAFSIYKLNKLRFCGYRADYLRFFSVLNSMQKADFDTTLLIVLCVVHNISCPTEITAVKINKRKKTEYFYFEKADMSIFS